MADPTTVAQEFARATAAEGVLSARIAVLEPAPPPPPPPPAATFHSTIIDGEVLSGPAPVPWLVVMDSGIADHIDFIVDGVVYWPEKFAPWGGDLDTTTIPNGAHTFTIKVYDVAGAVIATADAHVQVVNGAPPPPPPPPPVLVAVASGWASTKDNWRIGKPNNGDLSMRFRKRGAGPITGVAWQQRIGANYSAGDGGRYRASLQLAKADGTPTGTILASGTFTFNVNRAADAYFEPWMFDAPSIAIADGTLCHFVLENIHANPAANYISLNALFMWGDAVGPQRQPAFTNTDLALLSNVGSGWGETNETPNFDVLPSHEGFGYTQCNQEMWKPIGGSNQVREILTAPAASIRILQLRVRRVSGSGALTLIYETQAGQQIASGTVPASAIAISTPGGDTSGQVLATVTLPAAVSAPAGAMAFRATAPAGTTYAMAPIRKAVRDNVKTQPDWGSYMSPGYGQFSSNGGSSWASIYRSVGDQESLQFAALP